MYVETGSSGKVCYASVRSERSEQVSLTPDRREQKKQNDRHTSDCWLVKEERDSRLEYEEMEGRERRVGVLQKQTGSCSASLTRVWIW